VDRTVSSRWTFLVGVALVAAALGDAVVENVSNTGIFGRGFLDDDQANVIPTIACGCMLALELAVLRCIALVRAVRSSPGNDALRSVAADFSNRSVLRAVPFVLAVQAAALFVMESGEQLFVNGHLAGGAVWLGGPVLFALCTHAAIGALCTVLLARSMRAVVASLASLVCAVVRLVLAVVGRDSGACRIARPRATLAISDMPNARPFGGRAPPHHLSLVL
jgi:hypothetical protein